MNLIVMEDGDYETVDLATAQIIPDEVIAIGANLEWAKTRGEGVKVAVLDTGGSDHPDLVANLEKCVGTDSMGHGTHVAGLIGAVDNGCGVVGIAPSCRLLLYQVIPGDGASLIAAINQAAADGAQVINMSLGAYPEEGNDLADLHTAVKAAYALGVVLVAAAGNDPTRVSCPATYPEVIAVSALDEMGDRACFAPLTTNHVAMPGVNILSTWIGGQYARLSGTSQASPLLAGVIALILALHKPSPADAHAVVAAELTRIEALTGGIWYTPKANLI